MRRRSATFGDRRVVSERFPYLSVAVRIGSFVVEVDALIDTGFDGHVILPVGTVPPAERPDFRPRWRLADGSVIEAPAYVGFIRVGTIGEMAGVVTVLGGEALVGRAVIERFAVLLDRGERVIVEP